MFYLKNESEEFTAFKTYKAWAKRQLGTTLKCRQFDQGGEFLSNEQKVYMAENRIEYQMSMPDSPQQNGQALCRSPCIVAKYGSDTNSCVCLQFVH